MILIMTSLIEENNKQILIYDMLPDKLEKLQGHKAVAAM